MIRKVSVQKFCCDWSYIVAASSGHWIWVNSEKLQSLYVFVTDVCMYYGDGVAFIGFLLPLFSIFPFIILHNHGYGEQCKRNVFLLVYLCLCCKKSFDSRFAL